MIIIFGIQTKWTKFKPNSDRFFANGLKSDQLRKIRAEWQQCVLLYNEFYNHFHRAKIAKSRPFLGNLDLLAPKFQEV